jgi:hypothetical protein
MTWPRAQDVKPAADERELTMKTRTNLKAGYVDNWRVQR